MELKPHLIVNGQETDEWEFKAIIARPEDGLLDIILYKKKPLDVASSNSLETNTP